ncbi:hypothetical protein ACF08M_12740 [Streptomyces sp. NPDC015032]|uniref:hypothetical protein n=1 Tax=Streptomyces sp. NPDC015032 TaxID=3364937 RepID=UPI0036FF950E
MRAPIGSFENAGPAANRLDLLPPPVVAAVTEGWGGVPGKALAALPGAVIVDGLGVRS